MADFLRFFLNFSSSKHFVPSAWAGTLSIHRYASFKPKNNDIYMEKVHAVLQKRKKPALRSLRTN